MNNSRSNFYNILLLIHLTHHQDSPIINPYSSISMHQSVFTNHHLQIHLHLHLHHQHRHTISSCIVCHLVSLSGGLPVLLHCGVFEASTNQTLHVKKRLCRVDRCLVLSGFANESLIISEGHIGRSDAIALVVGDNLYSAIPWQTKLGGCCKG